VKPDSASLIATALQKDVQYLQGVGPDRGLLLQKLGLRTAQDLLFHFPRSYEFPPPLQTIAELQSGTQAAIVAQITEKEQRLTSSSKWMLGVLVEDSSGAARLIFFQPSGLTERFQRGQWLLIIGTPRLNGFRMEFVHPKVVIVDDPQEFRGGSILPVYGLTEGLQQSFLRRLIARTVEEVAGEVPEVLPVTIRERYDLPGIAAALEGIHRPQSQEQLEKSRERFIFQELLVLQLALALRRRRLTTDLRSLPLPATPEIDAAIRKRFPFSLTGDQERAIREVATDMGRQFPMNRLIQGDVGSGKTVVAEYAMLLAVAHHAQGVLMAPTELLARQHYATFERGLHASRVRLGLLTGTLRPHERRAILGQAAAGEIDILIGTQALLHADVQLPRLGLVVIDEQHKFGVAQRAQLRGDGIDPHCLVLSATPIPRTMAMTLFGDLELSTLREKPAGRGIVKTYLARNDWRDRWWDFVRQRLDEGRQAFVVTPLVKRGDELPSPKEEIPSSENEEADESGETTPEDVSTAESIYHQLSQGPLREYRVGLLHGRLSGDAKQAIMDQFSQGRLQVLVCTSVIEVGIDIPNATVMTILGAERFGLAQLHQLRGRIGRGKHPGHVGIFTDCNGHPEQFERLQVLARCDDGFELAEADYRLRGPGDLLGTRQSGLPPLRIADPQRDQELLMAARELAQERIEDDPHLENPEHARLRAQVLRRYGKVLELGDVG